MDTITKEYLGESIISGELEIAQSIIEVLPRKIQSNVLLDLAYDSESISVYTFIVKLLLDKETAYWHSVASQMFMVSLVYLNGADAVGFYHIKKAIELNPIDIDFKLLYLTYFNLTPVPLLNKAEAKQIASQILILDSTDSNALEVLKICVKDSVETVVIDKNDFYSLLYYGRFEEARDLVKDLTQDELFDVMVKINQKEKTITIYGYVVSLLIEQENAALHHRASRVLVELLNTIKGAYVSAYWHATRAVELDPQSIVYKLWLLQFYDLPGQLLNKDDAIKLAKEILTMEANNAQAIAVLEKINNDK